MPEFRIKITETLEKDVFIKAENKEEALRLAKKGYETTETDDFILTSSDYSGVDFQVVEEC